MTGQKLRMGLALTATTGLLAFGLAACGSDGDKSGSTPTTDAEAAAKTTGTANQQGGEITPDKKAPASAGDKSKNAPDRGISDRPGGPNSSEKP